MSKQKWFDCNGTELHEGDIVRSLCTGKEEKVFACHPDGRPNEESLGLNASNERFLELHPGWRREVYPFNNFEYYLKPPGHRCLMEYEKVVK